MVPVYFPCAREPWRSSRISLPCVTPQLAPLPHSVPGCSLLDVVALSWFLLPASQGTGKRGWIQDQVWKGEEVWKSAEVEWDK